MNEKASFGGLVSNGCETNSALASSPTDNAEPLVGVPLVCFLIQYMGVQAILGHPPGDSDIPSLLRPVITYIIPIYSLHQWMWFSIPGVVNLN